MATSSWTRANRTRRLGATVFVSAASTAALIGLDGTASAATPTEQSIDDAPSRVEENSKVTFTGTLTGIGDRPLVGEEVDLQRNTGSGWSVTETARTDQDGKVSIPVKITETADWRLSYGGDSVREADSSDTEHVESKAPLNERIVEAAAAQEGDPYSYGATGPDAFDCSGLTQYAHKQAGIELPRTSSDQRAATPEVAQSEKRPGDLVFFDDGGGVYHVAIYAGDNQVWTAPEEGENVQLKELWTDSYTVGRAW